MQAKIILSIPKQYEFNGISFEVSVTGLPWPLKKDGDPKARAGRKFYASIKPWIALTDADREKYRVGGGCVVIHEREGGV